MKLTEEILTVLSTAEVNDLALRITAGQLDRKLYLDVNKALEALGGKWDRKAKAHLFSQGNAAELIESAILTGEVTLPKNDLAFFPTSPKLAEKLVKMAGVKKDQLVLEPSAGTGRIVDAILAAGARVAAVERDTAMRSKLCKMSFSDGVTMVSTENDFLDFTAMADFDAVVMNPPFRKVGKGDHLDHVRHAYSLLRPKGVLVSVLPVSIEFRQDKRYTAFRDWYTKLRGTVERLPEGSFKEAGTNVNTVVLSVVRS